MNISKAHKDASDHFIGVMQEIQLAHYEVNKDMQTEHEARSMILTGFGNTCQMLSWPLSNTPGKHCLL